MSFTTILIEDVLVDYSKSCTLTNSL